MFESRRKLEIENVYLIKEGENNKILIADAVESTLLKMLCKVRSIGKKG